MIEDILIAVLFGMALFSMVNIPAALFGGALLGLLTYRAEHHD